MTTTTKVLAVGFAVLALAGGAAAQERRLLDEREAKRRATAFLVDGEGAPRPDLRKGETDDLEAEEVEDPLHGPAFDLLLRRGDGSLRLIIRVDRTEGRVTYFSQPERDCVVRRYRDDRSARPAEEVAEETRLRLVHDRAALREKAGAFLRHLVPGVAAGARRFEVVHASEHRDGLLVDAFVLVEAPGPGVLACHENLVQMDLNPETGEVVSVRWTDLRHEVREPPPVTAAAAMAKARERVGEEARPLGAPRLLVLRAREPGAFEVLWLVGFAPTRGGEEQVVAVDARTGRLVE